MKIAIVGAGLIGLNVGGRLAAVGGHDVTFFGRERYQRAVKDNGGLVVSGLAPETFTLRDVKYETDLALVDKTEWDFIIVTLKAVNTDDLAKVLKDTQKAHKIVSLQNGTSNAEQLQAMITSTTVTVYPAMVPFNVVLLPPAHFHQASGGNVFIHEAPETKALGDAFTASGMPCTLHSDMRGVLYSKLVLNLNNSVNAISGKPLRTELMTYGYRYSLACMQREALSVLAAANIPLASITAAPTWAIPYVFYLPDWLFSTVAMSILKVDESAMSSMQDDLEQGRKTEIDQLNGEIVRLGKLHSVPTPFNVAMIKLINKAEDAKKGSPKIEADELYKLLSQ